MHKQISKAALLGLTIAFTGCRMVTSEPAPSKTANTEPKKAEKPVAGQGEWTAEDQREMMVFEGSVNYKAACSGCHNGEGGGAPNILRRRRSPESLKKVVRNGEDDMPAIPVAKLSDAKLDSIVAYLQDATPAPRPGQQQRRDDD